MIHLLVIPISIALFYSIASPIFSFRMILLLNVILFLLVWAIYHFEIICTLKNDSVLSLSLPHPPHPHPKQKTRYAILQRKTTCPHQT